MPIEVLKDAFVEVNAVDLSDHVASVTINYSKAIQEAPVMGDAGTRRIVGLADWSADIEFRQDFDASKVDATIWPIVGTQVAFKCRKAKASALSATNPEYRGNGMIGEYTPISGGVGETHNTSVTVQGSDGVALTRNTV